MADTFNVGIIGCGVIAPSHIDSYNALEGVEVSAICDLLPERMEAISKRYPECSFRCFQKVEDLLADPSIQAVSICTDHASHEGIILQAIACGKHLICEKALATNSESVQRICAACDSSSLVTSGIFQHRFDPIYRNLKEVLADGEIGKLLTVSVEHQCWRPESYYRNSPWRGTRAGEGGSLLINQSIHFLDILQWVSGGVENVSARIANLGHQGIIETEDTVAVALQLNNGALATFSATSSSHVEWASAFHFVGSEGEIRICSGKLESCSHRHGEREESLRMRLFDFPESQGVEGAKAYYGTSHPAQIKDFVQAIREKRRPFVSLGDAAKTVELVMAIYKAAESGGTVKTALV